MSERAVPEWHLDRPRDVATSNVVSGWFLCDGGTRRGWIVWRQRRISMAVNVPSHDVAAGHPESAAAKACRFWGLLPPVAVEDAEIEFSLEFEAWSGQIDTVGRVSVSRGACCVTVQSPEEWMRAAATPLQVSVRTNGGARGTPRWDPPMHGIDWRVDQSKDARSWQCSVPHTKLVTSHVMLQVPTLLGKTRLETELGPEPPAAVTAEVMGFPRFAPPLPTNPLAPITVPLPADLPGGEVCVVTVCTVSHLCFARELAHSIREQHPDMPVVAVVADGDHTLPARDGGLTLVPAASIDIPRFHYLALKYNATDLCCALKPFAAAFAIERLGFARVLYFDADIRVFAPLTTLLDLSAAHDLVVTPHILSPFPNPERFWERPTLGDLAYAGILNAGLFAMRAGQATAQALRTWQGMVTSPGAFLHSLGGQMEQNSFNWLLAFVDDVRILRDAAYNVAYWNLHERSLRWKGLDEDGDRWTINGAPLVAFHFSGYSPLEPEVLSRHQNRYSGHVMPSLARLLDTYADRLWTQGAASLERADYRFGRFASGISIDTRIRHLFKAHEETLFREDVDPFSAQGEAVYCRALWSPVPHSGSLLPALLQQIYEDRPDLQQGFPDAGLDPDGLLRWLALHGVKEFGYEALFDRHRPTVPTVRLLRRLRSLQADVPGLFEGLDAPLGSDRLAFLDRAGRALPPSEWRDFAAAHGELWPASAVHEVRLIFEGRPDLRQAFPDPLGESLEDLVTWLEVMAPSEVGINPAAGAALRRVGSDRALARIFSYLNRDWHISRAYPCAMVGVHARACARLLMGPLRHGIDYTVDDVVAFLWLMESQPWRGVPFVLELGVNQARTPSSRLPEGQDALLADLIAADARFGVALERYRRRFDDTPQGRHDIERIREMEEGAQRPVHPRARRPRATEPAGPCSTGVNVFGYFKSPIGLGAMTRGLGLALDERGIPYSRNVIGNMEMAADLEPDDMLRQYRMDYDTNILVSYPHLRERLLNTLPAFMVQKRRNIAYLAWEQRDSVHHWREQYVDFDQVWALSSFAAQSLSRALDRTVVPVPCVLDTSAFPSAAEPRAFGLDPSVPSFLYIFDANSSIERKNPEGALTAFARAFGRRRDAILVMKASHGHRPMHQARMRALRAYATELGVNVRFVDGDWTHEQVLRLISACTCYVSLHRAEGFGYTCAEAMFYRRPVIASAYSGNLDFMTDSNALLVTCREVEVSAQDGPFQRGSVWADPDLDHAAALMRQVASDGVLAERLGHAARDTVTTVLSPSSIAGRIAAALAGGPGAFETPRTTSLR